MANDFSSKQIRASQLIASGGIGSTTIGLMIYSASDATDLSGGTSASLTSGVGPDVFLFVSGTEDGKNRGTGVSLFGGDVVVSGTLYAEKQVIEVDENVTGSMTVQGTLFVSSSADIAGGLTVNKDLGGTIGDGFIAKSSTIGKELIRALPNIDQVLVLSGGSDKSTDESTGQDVSFYVSGSVGFRGGARKGIAVLGGDLHVSGAVTSDVTQFGQWTLGSSPTRIYPNSAAGTHVLVGGTTLSAADTILASDGGATFNDNGASVDFRVESNTKENAILVDGSSDQVLILSGGSPTDTPESGYADLAFFVSGSIDSRGTTVKGTSVFGGDTYVSGVLYASQGISGSITNLTDGTSYISAGANITITSASNGQISIAGLDAPGFTRNSAASRVYLTNDDDRLNIGGGNAAPGNTSKVEINVGDPENLTGLFIDHNDTGATDGLIVESEGTGKAINTSGKFALYAKQDISNGYAGYFTRNLNEGGNEPLVNIIDDHTANSQPALQIRQDGTGDILRMRDGSDIVHKFKDGGSVALGSDYTASDTSFFVSGSISDNSKNNRISGGAALFGGDVVVSGSIYATDRIIGQGDPDTYIEYDDDRLRFISGGKELLTINESESTVSFNVDNNAINTIISTDTKLAFAAGSPLGAGKDQVLIMSGGAATSFDEAKADDVVFYVSGAIDSKGSSVRGTSVFGGDVVISGSLYGGSPLHVGDGLEVSGSTTFSGSVVFSGSADTIVTGSMTVTGSITVSGSLTVSGSDTFTVYGPSVFNEGGTSDSDFRIESDNKTHMVFVDTSTDQLLIMSGGSDKSTDEATANDVAFFVSGAIGSRGTTVRGSSIFGGDVIVSGTLSVNRGQAGAGSVVTVTDDGKVGIGTDTPSYKLEVGGNMALGEYLYHRADANTFLRFENDKMTFSAGNETLLTLTEDAQDIVIIGDGGDVDFQVKTVNDTNTLFVQGSSDRVGIGTDSPETTLHVSDTTPTIRIQRENNSNDSTLEWAGQAGVRANAIHLATNNDLVFNTWNGTTLEESLKFSGYHNSVVFLSGSGNSDKSYNEASGSDVAFYVSGSRTQIGGQGANTTGRHTGQRTNTVFGGDVVFSGSIYGGGEISAGQTALHFGADQIQIGAQTQVAISDNAGTAPGFGANNAGDVFFSVTGSIGSRGGNLKGTSVFGGDLVVSGGLRSGGQIHITSHKLLYGDTTARFVRFDSNGGDTSAGANNKMIAPYGGKLIKVLFRATAGPPGSTVIGLHTNSDGNANLNGTATEEITVNASSNNTSFAFKFTDDADWGPGDIVGLKINPTSDPGVVIATAVWEFDNTQD